MVFNPRNLLSAGLLSAFVAGTLALGLLPHAYGPSAYGEVRKSRLNQLIQQKPNLFLPTRLMVGEDNKFTMRVPAGNKVVLYLSPQGEGFEAPNGQSLRVGTEHEKVEGVASEKGVAVLSLPVPDEEVLVGRMVYVEAFTYAAEDFSDLEVLEILDATGRRAGGNRVAIERRAHGGGAMVLPGLPGMGSDILRRLTTVGDIQNGEERMKELIDDGDVNRELLQDQNLFIRRPDGANSKP